MSKQKSGMRERLSRATCFVYDQFFGRANPFDLAVARVLLYGYCFWRLELPSSWLPYVPSLFEPVGVFQWLPVLSATTMGLFYWLAKGAALAAALGIGYRPAAIVVALTAPYLFGFANNFVKVNHGLNVFVMALLPMAFARASDTLSIEAYLKRRKGEGRVTPSGEYRWPIRAGWLLIAGMYFSAGISKLVNTGWAWADGENFQRLLLRHHFTHSPPTEVGIWLAQSTLLGHVMALGALLLELLCPLLLLGGYFTLMFGGGLAALQLGIFLTLGVPFKPMIPMFLTLVPWERLCQRFGLLSHSSSPEVQAASESASVTQHQ